MWNSSTPTSGAISSPQGSADSGGRIGFIQPGRRRLEHLLDPASVGQYVVRAIDQVEPVLVSRALDRGGKSLLELLAKIEPVPVAAAEDQEDRALRFEHRQERGREQR